MADTTHSRTKDDIDDWIVSAALEGADEQTILTGVCERLNGLGCALLRVNAANSLLDPTLDARGVRWNRGLGGTEQDLPRTDDEDANRSWMRSPFYALVQSGERRLRRRLDASYRRGEYPILDELQDGGATDYVAFVERLGGTLRIGEVQGLISSWTTDAPDGFSDAQLTLLARIQPALALALLLRTWHRTARTLITTYLGADAAERVLAGNIVRGQAEAIRAVVWYSDLAGFTRISETVRAEGMLALLNDYAEVQVEAIEGHGGHVLKFIGDGMLAIFPHEDMTEACRRALDAAGHVRELIVALNSRRAASGLPVTDTHVALHLGDVLYGNVGSPRRLDFTVLGPAVNEAARIEALCGSLEQPVIVSSAFAEAAGAGRSRLVSLGRYAMKGVARPQELFTLDTP
jgi:adenylate cyclase